VSCGHPLCELIGGACSLATQRSRGCRPNVTAKDTAPEVLAEVRELVRLIEAEPASPSAREAAVRLASLVRREALDERNLIAEVHAEDAELGRALAALCTKRVVRRS